MRRALRDLWRICRSDKAALAGGLVVVLYLLVAVLGPYLASPGGLQSPANANLGPSLQHPLGTDPLGHDVFASIVVGTRPVMLVGVLAAGITVFIGVAVGLLSGYLGGLVDAALMRVVDIFLTIPGLPLIIVIAAIVHTTSPVVLAVVLSVTAWAGLARAVRSQALSLREAEFVEAARVQGLPLGQIIVRQLLPNVGPYVAIHFLLDVTGAIYAEVGLFLLGVAPITGTNWGEMINSAMSEGALYSSSSVVYLLSPMAAIVVLQVAFVFFARALDTLFNPRLRSQ
ncbi:MAG: ABC transporter permease [Actinobacteria bacterium]|jgi:peptide/nickel transport system permease protein|nr:ABC transporter permease [Actinomycetota bacterium]